MSQVITIDDLKSYMPNTLDSGRAQIMVDAVNTWVQTRTNRCFGETATIVERYDFGKTLWLRHQDVTDVASIMAGYPGREQTALDPESYFFNRLGRVTLFWQLTGQGPSGYYNDYLEVTYTYGVEQVPDDLKMAVLGVAAGFYNWAANGNRDISATSVGSYSVEYTNKRVSGNSEPDPATSTADLNFSIVDSYRQRRQ